MLGALLHLPVLTVLSLVTGAWSLCAPGEMHHHGCFPSTREDPIVFSPSFQYVQMYPDEASSIVCQEFCLESFYEYAGVAEGDLCYCSNSKKMASVQPVQTGCEPCAAMEGEFCGSNTTMSVYSCKALPSKTGQASFSLAIPTTAAIKEEEVINHPVIKGSKAKAGFNFAIQCLKWYHVGLFDQPSYFHYLKLDSKKIDEPMSLAACQNACSDEGIPWAGLIWDSKLNKHVCKCDLQFPSKPLKPSDMQHYLIPEPAAGRKNCLSGSGFCGGELKIDVFRCEECYWTDQGCRENGDKILQQQKAVSLDKVTPKKCKRACLSKNFAYAGLVDGKCFCGTGVSEQPESHACNKQCPGNPAKTCGGSMSMELFQCVSTTPANAPNACSLPGTGSAPRRFFGIWNPFQCLRRRQNA